MSLFGILDTPASSMERQMTLNNSEYFKRMSELNGKLKADHSKQTKKAQEDRAKPNKDGFVSNEHRRVNRDKRKNRMADLDIRRQRAVDVLNVKKEQVASLADALSERLSGLLSPAARCYEIHSSLVSSDCIPARCFLIFSFCYYIC